MVATIADADLLDLTFGGRADAFEFELLNSAHQKLGTLDVVADSPPTVRNDTSRNIFRTCSGLLVAAADLSQIDTLKDRVKVWMILQNGSRYPLGVFMFGEDVRAPHSWGNVFTPELFDETFIVDQPLDRNVSLFPGQSILATVNGLVGEIGLPDVDLSGVQDQFAGDIPGTSAGSSRSKLIVSLVGLLGCYPPYFNNAGAYTTKPAPGADATAALVYDSGGRIIAGSIRTKNSSFRAPNRYQVISNTTQQGYVGVYDLPATAPNSYANTGHRVVDSQSMQGLPSPEIAAQAAYVNALTDRNAYAGAQFDSTADPRHDTFEMISFLGTTMQETSWSLVCSSGGRMSHSVIAWYGPT